MPQLRDIAREWGRIGLLGFGGPPTHIAMLRELCVTRRAWLTPAEFEDAIAAVNLLPGPASTQLAIFCAHRVRGRAGALVGGLCFIVPGLLIILALAAVFLADDPPPVLRGAGAGAGSAVAAVAVRAGLGLVGPRWARGGGAHPRRVGAYAGTGALAAALAGAGGVPGLGGLGACVPGLPG